MAAKCFANPDHTFPATIRKHDGKGGYVITQWEYKAMFDDENRPAGIFCLGYDITAFTASQVQLMDARSLIKEILFTSRTSSAPPCKHLGAGKGAGANGARPEPAEHM